MDVFFYEAFEEERRALESCLPGHVQAGYTPQTAQEYGRPGPEAGLISIRTQSAIPLEWARSLDGILSRSTGYDHLERFLAESGAAVPCGYLPLYCSRSVAEHAALLWLALLRRLSVQRQSLERFHRDGLTGRECENKVLLVVGVGNIGSEVLRIGRGLGMKGIGVDIVERHPSVPYVSLEEGLAAADVIVCAMNLTADNAGYFGYGTLSRAKAGAVFVNVARGEFSPSGDLLRLLDEGRLGGVGLDVYDGEPELAVALRAGKTPEDEGVGATLRLAGHPDAILTPHNAFNTTEAVERKALHSAEQVEAFLRDGRFRWPIPPQEDPTGVTAGRAQT
ncbi:NAD(P)-dependent oxidoreductase [Verrucomicrobiota bacterium]